MNLIEKIREENLNVYRVSPQRLQEDVGQEGEIAQNYRGRLIYELMQNADDATIANSSSALRIHFLLTDSDLWVANSGRPLNEADVRGLCGISASSKATPGAKRRASIGHKGMGFKSVLEITDAPEVYSTTISFRFSQKDALRAVQPLVKEGCIRGSVTRAPITRFPWAIDREPREWRSFRQAGMQTVFRFPLRRTMTEEQRKRLAQVLQSLPVTSLIFLKHLERIEVDIRSQHCSHSAAWTVKRRHATRSGWRSVTSLSKSGNYQIILTADAGASETFVLAHEADIEIGKHRGGLNEFTWDGVDYTEVSLAVRLDGGRPAVLLPEWQKFHVFLPTGEVSPYGFLVNGAFSSSLSRQEIRVEADATNYNRYLLRQAARVLRDQMIPLLISDGVSVVDCLKLLGRSDPVGAPCGTPAAQALYEEVREAIADFPLVPSEPGIPLPIGSCAVPPLVHDPNVGRSFRLVLPADASSDGKVLPRAEFCGTDVARVLVDHGAHCLLPEESAAVLSTADPERSHLFAHPTGKLLVDPVLRVLESLWFGLDTVERSRLASAARCHSLFPVGRLDDHSWRRIPTIGQTCFYPPRSLHGEVPLPGLCFLMQDVCWGDLTPQERNVELKQQMDAWKALFDIREFKFPEVMRASVLPSLDLERPAESDFEENDLCKLRRLAAICQLAGRTPNPKVPLPYERLGSNRALFNLSRLAVPCRGAAQDEIVWVPAYRAYLGEDWVGERSVERILAVGRELQIMDLPSLEFLVPPDRLYGLLDQYRHLSHAGDDDLEDTDGDEVSLNEDDESALDDDDRSRWLQFFLWLGVNQPLRPVHFHDVEDRASGWLNTGELKRPSGWMFQNVPPDAWNRYVHLVTQVLSESDKDRLEQSVPFFYRLHDLEHLTTILGAAIGDVTAKLGRALYEHLALNWGTLERFSQVQVALIARGQWPSLRSKPPRARDNEIVEAGPDFWVFRLRESPFCPTNHGPRLADKVWWPTLEVKRRFERRARPGRYLVPVLDASPSVLKGRARGLAHTIGIRDELSPATFTLDDARILLERLRDLYGARCEAGDDLRQELREEIRPGYRHLFELLAGHEPVGDNIPTDDLTDKAPLSDAPLLAQDEKGRLSFLPASEIYYVDRRDTKERLRSSSSIWSFVIEASPAARVPLIQIFGVRELESSLLWIPSPGDPSLDETGYRQLRDELFNIGPYLLARLGTDRETDRLVQLDARRLRMLIETIEPVTHLDLRCELDGQRYNAGAVSREAFVLLQKDNPVQSFIVWGEHPWPPSTCEAEALVTALCDVFGLRYFEPFLALVQAPSTEARERILRRAGAPLDIDEKRALLSRSDSPDTQANEDTTSAEVEEPRSAMSSEAHEESPANRTGSTSAAGSDGLQRVALYKPGELLVDGLPITLFGDHSGHTSGGNGASDGVAPAQGSAPGSRVGYGGHTNLDALNELGMWITLSFERNRLRRSGIARAEVLDLSDDSDQPDAIIFDVSRPDRIERGRGMSRILDEVLRRLHEQFGVSLEWPGFDVLSLDPRFADPVDRLIELKSSGVTSRVQEMSWNEWKAAKRSSLCEHFYLYLVGNLRSDLDASQPYIRTIRNPFGQLRADVQECRSLQRKVQLSVYDFAEADELKLSVVHQPQTVDSVQAANRR